MVQPVSTYFFEQNRVHSGLTDFFGVKAETVLDSLKFFLLTDLTWRGKSRAEQNRDSLNLYSIPPEWKLEGGGDYYFLKIGKWKSGIFFGVGGIYRDGISYNGAENIQSQFGCLFFPLGITVSSENFEIIFKDRIVLDFDEKKNYFWNDLCLQMRILTW